MSNEVNKLAVLLTKEFYKAIDKRVTPAIMKQGIGQFKSLLNVYEFTELMTVINYISEGNVPNVYSPGYLSYATNKLLDEIKIKQIKNEVKNNDKVLKLSLDNKTKTQKSNFYDKFM